MTSEYIENLYDMVTAKSNKERFIVRCLTVYPIYAIAAIMLIPALIVSLPALMIFGFGKLIDNQIITPIFKSIYRKVGDRLRKLYAQKH